VFSSLPDAGDAAWKDVRLEAAVGNYALFKREGEMLRLPAALVQPTAALVEAPDVLAVFPARKPYHICLTRPTTARCCC
jgi:hypothetical protein